MKLLQVGLALAAAFFATSVAAQISGFEDHVYNGRDPQVRGKKVTFTILNGECNARDYGDGRGESHCWNGNVSSRLAARRHVNPTTSATYSFYFRVDPSFAYRGNRLEIALWQRTNTVKNHLYELELNSQRGATFEGVICVPPAKLASWNDFSLQVTWKSDAAGKLVVKCNGRTIYQRTGNVLIPEDCGSRRKLQCEPARQDLNKPIQLQIGPLMRGYGGPPLRGSRTSAFEVFQDNGITIQVRDLKITRG